MSVKTYDPSKVLVIVGGVPVTGFAKDSKIKFKRDEDTFKKHVGVDGEVSRAKSSNKAGELTISLAQTSASNDTFSTLAQLDEQSNSGVVPVSIKDLSGTTTIFSAQAWIKKMPDVEIGTDIKNIDWVFDCGATDLFIGGNN